MSKVSDKTLLLESVNYRSQASLARALNVHPSSVYSRAKRLGLQKNQSGRGLIKTKINDSRKIPLKEILEGKHPSYQTNKLRLRLIKEGIFENRCDECKICEWNGQKVVCELDHVNGDRHDHRLHNLRLLCPNCHSLTPTFRGKNKRR